MMYSGCIFCLSSFSFINFKCYFVMSNVFLLAALHYFCKNDWGYINLSNKYLTNGSLHPSQINVTTEHLWPPPCCDSRNPENSTALEGQQLELSPVFNFIFHFESEVELAPIRADLPIAHSLVTTYSIASLIHPV